MTSGKPRWRALADELAGDIRSGRRKPGEQLPSLADYTRDGFSQTLVLRAFGHLAAQGLAHSIQGRGTFVADPLPKTTGTVEERLERLEELWAEHTADGHGRTH